MTEIFILVGFMAVLVFFVYILFLRVKKVGEENTRRAIFKELTVGSRVTMKDYERQIDGVVTGYSIKGYIVMSDAHVEKVLTIDNFKRRIR